MPEPSRQVDVAILAFPEATASVVYGFHDLFHSVGRDWGLIVDGKPGSSPMTARVVATQRGPFIAANGVRIQPDGPLDFVRTPDVVCIPEILVAPGDSLEGHFDDLLAWLRHCYSAGATLATACSGAMLLAEAGLLDGYDATTHWAYCDVMRHRYPRVRVHRQRALVASGAGQRLVMAGGGTSWLDLALYVIARYTSVDAAMQVARINLIDWHHAGQQPFARLARSRQVDDALIARCQAWIADHYREPAPVAAMAKLSGLPERSFKRRFEQATGMSPLEYVHTVRLEEAKQMLEATNLPIEAIANEAGYEDAGFFARLFKRNVDLTPGQYRKRFGAVRRALEMDRTSPANAAKEPPPATSVGRKSVSAAREKTS